VAAQVGHHEPVAVGEQRDDVPPDPPVLRPPVQQHERVARARLGDVDGQAADVDPTVGDTGQVGQRDGGGGHDPSLLREAVRDTRRPAPAGDPRHTANSCSHPATDGRSAVRALRPVLAATVLTVGSLTFAASAEEIPAAECREIRPATETTAAAEACRQDVFAHVSGGKVGNVDAPVWDTTAPTASYTSGAGGGFYQARLLDIVEPNNPTYRPPLSGTYTGVLDAIAVTAYVTIPVYAAGGTPYPLLTQVVVDGVTVFENEEEIDVPLTTVEGNTATRKLSFNVTDVAKVLERRRKPLGGEHTVSIAFTPRYWGDGQSVVFYDAKEFPTGVQFNVDPASELGATYTAIKAG
jgi:hypothetical protein